MLNPHWSRNGATTLFKTRYRCTGTYPAVKVGSSGALAMFPSYPRPQGTIVATSKHRQNITTSWAWKPFSTPKEESGLFIKAWEYFRGGASGRIISPGTPLNIGSGRSRIVYVEVK